MQAPPPFRTRKLSASPRKNPEFSMRHCFRWTWACMGESELSVLWLVTAKQWEELVVWWARSQQEGGGWRDTLRVEGSPS